MTASDGSLNATAEIIDASPGTYDVEVTVAGQTAVKENAITIIIPSPPPPRRPEITDVLVGSPGITTARVGDVITIQGIRFASTSAVSVTIGGNVATVLTGEMTGLHGELNATAKIIDASPGTHDVAVTVDGQTAIKEDAITIIIVGPPPPSEDKLILIPGGWCTVGADAATSSHLIKTYGLGGTGFAEQLSNPKASTVQLAEFKISKYAVSNAEYEAFVKETGWHAPKHWQGETYAKGTEDFPVTNVTFLDAEGFCQWKGVRLPTNDEWERAARGSNGFSYPWGNKFQVR
jgi:hypothetical protein